MSPSDKLKDIRNKLGLSQMEISRLLFMSQSGWSNCERGIRNLSINRCYKLIELAKLKEIYISIEYLRPF
jgi:transcriptional regulator with XRE-family HTH domain